MSNSAMPSIGADIVVERPALRLHVQHVTARHREDDWEMLITKPCDDIKVEFFIKEGPWAGYSCYDLNPFFDAKTGILTIGHGYHEYKGKRANIRVDLNTPDMTEVKALVAAHKARAEERHRLADEAEKTYQAHYQTVLRALDSEEPVETTEELLRRVSAEEAAQAAREED